MRFIQLERTSSPPTTSCGPSSCRLLVVAWTRRPHTLWREVMLATGKTRSTEWSGGWTELMVSCGLFAVSCQKPPQFFLDVVHDAYTFFPILSTVVKISLTLSQLCLKPRIYLGGVFDLLYFCIKWTLIKTKDGHWILKSWNNGFCYFSNHLKKTTPEV